ncbi:MAG: hypothetical protein RR595_09705 [Lysinibacillus sp.]
MAEIGSLAVSLSMDASNFNGTVSQVDRNLRAMGGELQAVRAQGTEFGQSVEGLSQKQDILQRSLTASSLKLQEQRRKYDEMVASGNVSEAALERQAAAVNRAQAQYNRFQTELDQVTAELSDLQSVSVRVGQAVTDLGDKATATGGKMKDIGGTMTASVTGPLLAIGAGAIAVAAQFDTAQARIQTELGVTAEAAKELEGTARNVWKAGFGESLDEVTSALVRVKQNMKEIDGNEIEGVTKNALALAKSFDSDVNEVTRAANNLMVNFGISSEEAFDQLANGAQNGLNFSNELFDNVAEYSGLFSTLGFETDEYFSLLSKGAEAGVYNLDYLNDVVKEFGIRIKDGSDGVSDALAQLFAPDDIDEFTSALMKSGKATQEYATLTSKVGKETADELVKNLQKGGKSAEDASVSLQIIMGEYTEFTEGIDNGSIRGAEAMDTILQKIQALESPTERAQLGVALFGTKWEDLEETAMFSLIGMSEGLDDVSGTMGKLVEVQEQTFGQRWDNLTRSAASSLEPAGKILLTIAEDWLPKVAEAVEDVTQWFAGLSPEAQGATLAIGGIAAVAGPAVAVLGMFVSGIGGIATVTAPVIGSLAGATSGVGFLGSALAVATGPVGLTVAAVAALGVGVYALSQDLGESSIQVEDWSSKVSESTAEAVGGFMELSEQASGHLSTLSITGQAVTQEMATNITSIFNQMGQQVLAEMQTNHEEQLAAVTNFYANSNVLIESEEAEILARTAEYQANKENQISEGNTRIAEIMTAASNEKRELTLAEEAEINRIHATMKDNAIKYLTESELEQQVIYESIKNNASEISALQAAEVVKNSVKQKDEVVKEAEEQYKKAVAEIIKQRDEMGVISAAQSKQLIEDAGKQRDETIKAAEDQHEKIVAEAKAQAGEHVAQVDWETGEIKSKWQVMKRDITSRVKEIGSDVNRDWTKMYNDVTDRTKKIGTDVKNDWTKVYNDSTEWVGKMADSIDKDFQAMGKNVGIQMNKAADTISEVWDSALAIFDIGKLKQIGKDMISGLISGINSMADDAIESITGVVDGVVNKAKSLLKIASPSKVFKQIGLWTGEGLAIGIDGSSAKVNTAMENIADGILSVSEKFQKEYSNLIDDFNSKNESKNDKTLEKIQKIRTVAAKKKRDLTAAQLQEIANLEASYQDNKMKTDRDFNKRYLALVQQSEKEYLEVVKTYIAEKKSLDQLSLLDEVEIWERSVEIFNEGSKERLVAQKEYKAAVEGIDLTTFVPSIKELTSTH